VKKVIVVVVVVVVVVVLGVLTWLVLIDEGKEGW